MASLVPTMRQWVTHHLPRRETIHRYRLLRPFAHHLTQPNLWRMNRRSVPRAVALGLGVGILVPFMHMALAALLAIPTRANVAIAAAFTLLINPVTIPPIYFAALRLGQWELHERVALNAQAVARMSGHAESWLEWMRHASAPIALGVLTLALIAAAGGYAIGAVAWRWRVGNRWRLRKG